MNNTKSISKWIYMGTFVISIASVIIGIIMPSEWYVNTSAKPLTFILLLICPVLGIIGLIFSIIKKSFIWAILNTICIFAFPIVMYLGYLFLGA